MTPELKAELEQFRRERDEALLSMDEEKIRAMVRKWNKMELPQNSLAFWGAVHKTITGINTLPMEMRQKSFAWLTLRGFKSLDDGDLKA